MERKSNYILNNFEKTDFSHIENYPLEGSFSIVVVEIDDKLFYVVRGIYNKAFYEGIFDDEIKANESILKIKGN